jgi:hypothetical protein
MFIPSNQWGFPHKVKKIVTLYEQGQMTLEGALCALSGMYNSRIVRVNTSSGMRSVIEFGTPVVCSYLV